jgi:hypothetical protein
MSMAHCAKVLRASRFLEGCASSSVIVDKLGMLNDERMLWQRHHNCLPPWTAI